METDSATQTPSQPPTGDEMRSDELGATSPVQGTAQGTNHHDD
jgi:hypothetical protein